ncbi:MAG: hypothetical protein MRJ92_02880 [Nitrospira sp.]|nr:hypothetical protein [Nitrospira sp.]
MPTHRLVIDWTYEQLQEVLAGAFAGVEWQYQTAYFLSITDLESSSSQRAEKSSYTVNLKGGYKTMVNKHWGIRPCWLENVFDENYAFAALNPANAPAFGPFIGPEYLRQSVGQVCIRVEARPTTPHAITSGIPAKVWG